MHAMGNGVWGGWELFLRLRMRRGAGVSDYENDDLGGGGSGLEDLVRLLWIRGITMTMLYLQR